MSDTFAMLREQALKKSESCKDEDFVIRGLWKTDLLFKPNVFERTFMYSFVLAQTVGQGCCYCEKDLKLDEYYIGKDAREIIPEKYCISIAVLDSIFSSIPKQPQQVYELRGNSIEKAIERKSIIVKEAEDLLKAENPREASIVNVGAVGNIVKDLKEKNYSVFATDFDEAIIGKSLHGVTVEHGSKTLEYVGDCDLAIITGMTISTDSLDEIVETAKKHNTKLLVFAETGANFAEEYCQTIGIDVAVSEQYPFYIFQGVSTIEVYRRE